jgi:acetolactate synthase-1/2/3 large subunit
LAGLPLAYYSSVPMLAITGQVQTTAYGRGAHQESTGWFRTPNQEAMFAPTVKHTTTCDDARRFPDFVRHSIRIALSGRPGPTHLIIPANLLHQKVEYEPMRPAQYRLLNHRPCDEEAIGDIARRIAAAEYPLLFVGERAFTHGMGATLQSLSERYSFPVLADLSSKSVVDEYSAMYLGCMGVMGHRAGERYLKEQADLVVAIGQSFNEVSTLSWEPAIGRGRDLIQLDNDPQEIGKVYPVTAASAGHLPTMVNRLGEHLAALEVRNQSGRAEAVEKLRQKFPLFEAKEMKSVKTPPLPQRVTHELHQALPEDAIVLSDSSKWNRWLGRFLQVRRGAFITAHDYEPMGWAVAGVIGAKVAHPDRPVICVSGDGAFLMSAMELSTAANHDLDIIWVVMNDSRLGIIYDLQKALYGGGFAGTTFENPDLVTFAKAFGIKGYVTEQPGELEDGLRAAVAEGGSALFDVRFDPDEIPAVRPRSLLITKEMGLPNPRPSPETTRALIKLLKEK